MAAVRVAFDVGPLAGRRTGIGAAVAEVRAGLEARGDVELRPYVTSFRAPRTEGVARLPIPAAAAHRLWSSVAMPRVDRWIGDVDVVHGTNYVVPPSRRPRVVSVYDCWFLDHPELAHPDVRRAGRVLRRSVDTGAVVHACSAATARRVRHHFPAADVVTIPLGALALGAASSSSPLPQLHGRPFVVAVATLERRKNVPTLVRAFATAAGSRALPADLVLVIAGGDGDDRAAVDAAIATLAPEVGSRVLLAGWVSEEARSWLLRHALALAYPSLDEGFGFPLLDAMQAGLPIVAADVGSIPEVAGAAALLSAPTDVDALGANLVRAVTDGAVRARLVAAGAEQLARFTWPACVHALAELYRRVAGSTSALRRAEAAR